MADNFTKDGAPTGGVVIHPRAWITLSVFLDDKHVDTGFIPSKVSLRRGSHNKADECEVTLDGNVLPFPLPIMGKGFLCVYLGVVDAPDAADFISSLAKAENLRFCGWVEEADQDLSERTITFKSQDMSRILRTHKPLLKKRIDAVAAVAASPAAGIGVAQGGAIAAAAAAAATAALRVGLKKSGPIIDPTPRYSDTLAQAINRILSVVPGFDDPTEDAPLSVRKTDALSSAKLSSLVSGRAINGPVTIKPDWSAWQAIEHVCGLCSRHVGIELREIVVRSPEEVFKDADPDPNKRITFVIGSQNANAAPPKFHKRFVENRKGVKVIAFNSETRRQVSAVYPGDADVPPARITHHKKVKTGHAAAHKVHHSAEAEPPDRDVFELSCGTYSDSALLDQAKKIYLERATQECDGTVMTPFWDERILNMRNGTRFFVKLHRDLDRKIDEIGDDALAARFLQQELIGTSLQNAQLLLAAIKKPAQDFWYCRNVTLEWPGEMLAHVDFINLVTI